MNTKLPITALISILIIVLAILLLDPFMLLMPGSVTMMVILLLAVVFAAYTIFIYREQARDERELAHRMAAARLAWLIGAGVALIGIVYEGLLEHTVDQWLIFTLVATVIGKLTVRSYLEKKN